MRDELLQRYFSIRNQSVKLCEGLLPEDLVIQSMPDASPLRWHLAHTTWFFETFLLKEILSSYEPWNPHFEVLFNSYYNSVGEQFPRANRGLLTRPSVQEIFEYRHKIDEIILQLIKTESLHHDALRILEIGLQHEQQHQELMLTDLKHMFSCNPLFPIYRTQKSVNQNWNSPERKWIAHEEGLYEIGARQREFCYDNELPRHRQFVESFSLSNRLVTNAEYLVFIEEGGYRRPEFWLSMGWQAVESQKWSSPLYWHQTDDGWSQFTLSGLRSIDGQEPVTHVSYFEADAYARWAGCRLPEEAEWEIAAEDSVDKYPELIVQGNYVESEKYHPQICSNEGAGSAYQQLFGDVWEWTRSQYSAYPGYHTPEGAIGEYNGKFMCNQFVLRGGSCATSASHIRSSYRNFFPPETRWQFSGIRLAK
ncbi:ergothioneine biosynthesis protein EgtB [Rubinisphaera italica]|nr:ergothioneine biosynthesis protein EgtB [Rubinisphaera italica]